MAKKSEPRNQNVNAAKGGDNGMSNEIKMHAEAFDDHADMGEGNEQKGSKSVTEKAMKALITHGKKQGFLTYDEINTALPDEMLSTDQMDDTLMMFDDLGIDIIDENNQSIAKAKSKKLELDAKLDDGSLSDYGSVTDPVKMYLREMGLVTLLSREGEVEIAKKIEAGEQDVLRALLETTLGVEYILDLGRRIENQVLRPKHVLRDVDEGDTYQDEMVQIESFMGTIKAIAEVHTENLQFRDQLFNGHNLKADEQRRIRRCITRRNQKIFDSLKDWRLEGNVIDQVEEDIRNLIDWFDANNRVLTATAEAMNVPVVSFRESLGSKTRFLKISSKQCELTKKELEALFTHLSHTQSQIVEKENAIKANSRILKRILSSVDEGTRPREIGQKRID